MPDEKLRFEPPPDTVRESELIRAIENLKQEYHEAARPFFEELALIRARQPLRAIVMDKMLVEEVRKRLPPEEGE